MRRCAYFVALALVAAAATAALGAEPAAIDETRASVPALSDFHDVIYPLWHDAWPNKNYALIQELLPQVQQHVGAIEAAELPGILRDKKAEWTKGVQSLAGAAGRYEKAVTAHDEKGMLDAVEALHADFEALVRVVRPAMKELDAYHVELYRVYHKILPDKKLEELPAAADALVEKCRALAAAAVPKRFAAREPEIRREVGVLCGDTEALRAAAKGGATEAIPAAVEKTHSQYQKLEALFR